MKKYLKKYYIETIALLIIITFSLLNIKKAYLLNLNYKSYFNKALLWLTLSVIIYILIRKIKFKHIFKARYIIYGLNIILLLYVLLFSKSINKTKAWINIFGLTIQPSELLKITYPLVSISLIKDKKYFISTILFIVPLILILLEPDTGNAILLFIIYLYLITNNRNKKYITLGIVMCITLLFSFIILFKFKPNLLIKLFNGTLYYRFKRLFDYKKNYQIKNALIGIGNAELLPISFKKILIYIPEGITDFIFAFHICNFGIILTIILLLSYITFINEIIKKYNNSKRYFEKKLIGSFLVIFIIQLIYNILMNIGLIPIMGIPLPFFSYGGSNIITYFIFYSLINKKNIL